MNSETVAPHLYLENWHYSIRMEWLRKCLWYPESPLQFQRPSFGRYDDLVKGFAAMYSLFPWPGVPVWLIILDIFQEFSRILLCSVRWEILTIPHKPRGQVVYGESLWGLSVLYCYWDGDSSMGLRGWSSAPHGRSAIFLAAPVSPCVHTLSFTGKGMPPSHPSHSPRYLAPRVIVLSVCLFVLAMPLGMWDLPSLTWDQTHAHCSGSRES